jgi:threonine dehydrogenase-like Zn-dependent dehydrogenase
MQALVKTAAGPGNMELRDVPEPLPGSGEVKVRVMAASICGSDVHIRRGDIGIPMRFPVIPGHEFSGVITEVGAGVTGLEPGERVTAENTRSSCGVCPQCAFCAQYAKANGGVVILTGAPQDGRRLELGRALGADHAFSGTDTEERIRALGGEAGVDVVLECSGAEAAAQMGLRLLKRQGQYTQVGIFGHPVRFDLDTVLYREIRLTGSFSQKFIGWQNALALCAQGKVKVAPLITHTFPLAEWERAFDVFERGEAIKVVFALGVDTGGGNP